MSIRYNLRLYYGIVLKNTKNVPSPCAEKSTFDDPFTRNREACVFSLVQSTAIKYASLFLSNFFISRLFLFPAGTFPPTQISPTMYRRADSKILTKILSTDIYCIFPVIENGLKIPVKYYSEVP